MRYECCMRVVAGFRSHIEWAEQFEEGIRPQVEICGWRDRNHSEQIDATFKISQGDIGAPDLKTENGRNGRQ